MLTTCMVVPEGDLRFLLTEALRPLPVRIYYEVAPPVDWSAFVDRLVRLSPALVWVDYERTRLCFEELANRVKAAPTVPLLVAVAIQADPEQTRRALEAGADEFLVPPFELGVPQLLRRAEQLQLRALSGGRPGKVLGVLGTAGGVGATTLACHLAVELRRQQEGDVLLADLGVPPGPVAFLMKVETPDSFLDAAANLHRWNADYWRDVTRRHPSGVFVLAPSFNSVTGEPWGREQAGAVGAALRWVRAYFRWAVLDLEKRPGSPSWALLSQLDVLVVVSTAHPLALAQARWLVGCLRNAGVELSKVRWVLNRMSLDPVPWAPFERYVGLPVAEEIPEHGRFSKSVGDCILAPPGSPYGKSVRSFVMRLLGHREAVQQAGSPLHRAVRWLYGVRRVINKR
jgi:CheY-like chemotaxis protein